MFFFAMSLLEGEFIYLVNIRFQNVPDLMLVSEEAEFYLQLDTELYGVKASTRFVKGSGRVYISGYDATRGEGVALEKTTW